MHFCDVTLSAKKLLPDAYPKILQTIGDHIRKKRLDLKLFQKDVAVVIGVDEGTVYNWEKNRGYPAVRLIPKIITFLGYDPFGEAAPTLGERIKQYRRRQGLSIKKFAKILEIDPTTLARWERGEIEPHGKLRKSFSSFFDVLR